MMKKLLVVIAILLLPVFADAAYLTGMTPSSYSIPSGWSLLRTQDFETVVDPPDEYMDGGTAAFNTIRAHSGTRSIRGYYAGDGQTMRWILNKTTVGSFDEIYVSMWEYYDSAARFNDELHVVRFKKNAPSGSEAMQVVFDISGGFNVLNGGIWLINEGVGEGYGGYWNSYYGPTVSPWGQGTWVQWEVHFRPNTYTGTTTRTAVADGFMRVYQNGVLKYSRENAVFNGKTDYRNGGVTAEVGGVYTKHKWYMDYPTNSVCSTSYGAGTGYARETNWTNPCSCPNQCPPTGYVPKFYRYFDDIIVMKVTGTPAGDTVPPYTTSHSPPKNATGVPVGTTSASFGLLDSSGTIITSSISMGGPDGTKTCTTGTPTLTCTEVTTSNYTVTYPGMTLSNDQVASFTLTANDNAGNNLTDAWSWTVEAAAAPSIEVTTTTLPAGTEGVQYSQTLSATGGTTPYTWTTSDALPTGLALSTSGVISGTPTTAGTTSFTVTATDSAASPASNNQALSILVNPGTPSGGGTVQNTNFADTWTNSGSGDTNYGDNPLLKVYTWPYGTVANRTIIMDNVDIRSIPANVDITAAKLRLYLVSHTGSGGTDPMYVNVYPITGTVPDTTTVTWNNFAGTIGSAESYTPVALTPGWYEWNVVEAVKSSYNAGTPLYLAFDGGPYNDVDSNRSFASVDHTTAEWRPQLIVTYMQLSDPSGTSVPTPGKMKFRSKGRWRSFR